MNKTLNPISALSCLSATLPKGCEVAKKTSPCIERIQASLEQAVKQLGYDCVRYACWLRNMSGGKSETSSFSINFSNFPPAWEHIYNSENMYLNDPVVRVIQDYASNKHLVYGTWHSAYDWAMKNPLGEDSNQQHEYNLSITQMILRAREQGLMSGYYYSMGDNLRQIVVSLGSSQKHVEAGIYNNNDNDILINALHSMVILVNQSIQMTQLCARCTKSLRMDGAAPLRLSGAERRILHLYYQHRTASQKHIASEFGRSTETVSHHLRSVRRKLKKSGASGYALATYAAELNLL